MIQPLHYLIFTQRRWKPMFIPWWNDVDTLGRLCMYCIRVCGKLLPNFVVNCCLKSVHLFLPFPLVNRAPKQGIQHKKPSPSTLFITATAPLSTPTSPELPFFHLDLFFSIEYYIPHLLILLILLIFSLPALGFKVQEDRYVSLSCLLLDP